MVPLCNTNGLIHILKRLCRNHLRCGQFPFLSRIKSQMTFPGIMTIRLMVTRVYLSCLYPVVILGGLEGAARFFQKELHTFTGSQVTQAVFCIEIPVMRPLLYAIPKNAPAMLPFSEIVFYENLGQKQSVPIHEAVVPVLFLPGNELQYSLITGRSRISLKIRQIANKFLYIDHPCSVRFTQMNNGKPLLQNQIRLIHLLRIMIELSALGKIIFPLPLFKSFDKTCMLWQPDSLKQHLIKKSYQMIKPMYLQGKTFFNFFTG